MAYELTNRETMFFLARDLLRAAVEGPALPKTRLYVVAVCTICGDPYERHGEFDPDEVNRVPRCRCCSVTKVVPVRTVTKIMELQERAPYDWVVERRNFAPPIRGVVE